MSDRIKAAIGNMRTHLWLDAKKNPVWVLVDRGDLEVILAYVKELEGSHTPGTN